MPVSKKFPIFAVLYSLLQSVFLCFFGASRIIINISKQEETK